jgi:hypothetical protein
MKLKVTVLATSILIIVVIIALPHFHTSVQSLRTRVKSELPIGSSRGQVEKFLSSYGDNVEVTAFDYPFDHPLHGRLKLVTIKPILSRHYIYLAFYFDKKQKLESYEISEKPIQPKEWPQK